MVDLSHVNILTFNSHQPHNYYFSKVGAKLYIIHDIPGKNMPLWDPNVRPCPPNVVLLSRQEAEEMYHNNRFDLAVCHNISDLMEIKDWKLKKVLYIHETVRGRIMTERSRIGHGEWVRMVKCFLETLKDVHLAFVSSKKARDWHLEGTIIELGIDPHDYPFTYKGHDPTALTVSNQFKLRGNILGYHIHQSILQGLPCRIIGYNPGLNGSRPAKDWEDLKENYRRSRVYLYTAQEDYEDGYNNAMLEAMATGMPVISYKNDSSPIQDGKNGYISEDISYLRQRLTSLLKDGEKAAAMGREACRTALRQFGIHRYLEKWQRLIERIL